MKKDAPLDTPRVEMTFYTGDGRKTTSVVRPFLVNGVRPHNPTFERYYGHFLLETHGRNYLLSSGPAGRGIVFDHFDIDMLVTFLLMVMIENDREWYYI